MLHIPSNTGIVAHCIITWNALKGSESVTWSRALFLLSPPQSAYWVNAMIIKNQALKKTSIVIKTLPLGETQKNCHSGAQDTKIYVEGFSQIVVSNLRAHKIFSWWSFVVTTQGQSKFWQRNTSITLYYMMIHVIIIAGRPSIIAGLHNVHCWEPKYILGIDQCPVVCARFLFKTTQENHKY